MDGRARIARGLFFASLAIAVPSAGSPPDLARGTVYALTDADPHRCLRAFQLPGDGLVRLSGFGLHVQGDAPTGQVIVRLETDDGGAPSGRLIAPSAVATLSAVRPGAWNPVTFQEAVPFTAGAPFWVVVETEAPLRVATTTGTTGATPAANPFVAASEGDGGGPPPAAGPAGCAAASPPPATPAEPASAQTPSPEAPDVSPTVHSTTFSVGQPQLESPVPPEAPWPNIVLGSQGPSRATIPVRVTGVTSSQVTVAWDPVSGAEGYHLFLSPEPMSTSSTGVHVPIAAVAADTTTYRFTDLASAVDLFIQVEAVGSDVLGEARAETLGGPRAALDTPVREVHLTAPDQLMVVIANPSVISDGGPSPLGDTGADWQGGVWTVRRADGTFIGVTRVSRHSVPVGQPDYTLGFAPNELQVNDQIVDVDHRLYLTLAEPVGAQEVLTITHAGTPATTIRFLLPFSDRYLTTPVIQVNQVGYNPVATHRWAYVSWWLGDGGGLSLGNFPAAAEVVAVSRDPLTPPVPVLTSVAIAPRRAFDTDAGAEVRQIDLAGVPVSETATYRVRIPGVGVSWPTTVSAAAAEQAFAVAAGGLFFNRWGRDLSGYPEWGDRPPDHPLVYTTDLLLGSDGVFFGPETPRAEGRPLAGGYHDAGDFDQRRSHSVIPQLLLRAYELNPRKFFDGQLNIPERHNGVPDLLDEALYGVQGWQQLQDPDGGVHAGVESWRHPWGYYYADQEPADQMPYWARAADADVTAHAAALFAQAARLVAPFEASRAATLRDAATRAWQYAVAHGAAPAPMLHAASELLRLTADAVYQSAFEQTLLTHYLQDYDRNGLSPTDGLSGLIARDLQVSEYQPGQTLLMGDYLVGYAQSPSADPTIVTIIRSAIRRTALESLSASALEQGSAHRNSRAGTYDWGYATALAKNFMAVFAALQLGGWTPAEQQAWFDALSLNADYMFGGNPAGISWTTGLGARSPQEPLHLDSLAFIKDGKGPVPGIAVYGVSLQPPQQVYYQPLLGTFYPAYGDQPPMDRYADDRTFVTSSEFTTGDTIAPNALLLATLLPAPPAAPSRAQQEVQALVQQLQAVQQALGQSPLPTGLAASEVPDLAGLPDSLRRDD